MVTGLHTKAIPAAVKTFALRAIALVSVWVLLYNFILQPQRIPDRWLSNATAFITAKFVSLIYTPATNTVQDVFACVTINHRNVIRIGDPCNALDLMALYVAFIIAMPTSLKRMLYFSAGGVLAIFILNVFRCSALAWIVLNKQAWLHFSHKFLFTAIVYACIFYFWTLYLRKFKA